MKILVTGAKGMIGSHLVNGLLYSNYEVLGVDRLKNTDFRDNYTYYRIDLANRSALQDVIIREKPDRIVHLAALAHSVDGKEYSWEDYKHLNIECAKNVFFAAGDIPVLYISTVDVLGFTNGIVSNKSPMKPVSNYGKSKMIAEQEVSKKKHFDIFRFSPVYTDNVKRDIQKRYYLKYPNIAYLIGKGTEYEILNVKKAVQAMVDWCSTEPQNTVQIIKDEKRMWTPDYVKNEKKEGRAKIVIKVPAWIAKLGYTILKGVTGENKYTYLLNKAVYPVRSE